MQNVAVVVTSIAKPNESLQTLSRGCQDRGYQFIVIGDESSPADFHLDGCRFYSLAEQSELPFKIARLIPTRHYARKNLGYLIALRNGASVILETDDDNIPYEGFWDSPERVQSVPVIGKSGWVNIYSYFSDVNIWPRGLPLSHIHDQTFPFETLAVREADCPITQGLVDANPDTDAVYRLVFPHAQYFRRDRRVALSSGSWSPFNSQNTTWWRAAFPLMYLPAYCSFRVTDIWRSFIAQRIAWTNDWSIGFHGPTVWQQRNEHDLMIDFRDEVPAYLHNQAISQALIDLPLASGVNNLTNNLRRCYEKLVSMDIIPGKELDLVEAWTDDLEAIIKG